jgi:hypothetical protein
VSSPPPVSTSIAPTTSAESSSGTGRSTVTTIPLVPLLP